MLDLQAPILVIGAGRSGSTLLSRILQSHPEIAFFEENSFLAARLWLELWEDRFWLVSELFNASDPKSALDPRPAVPAERLEQEKRRIGALVAETVNRVHRVEAEVCRVWGYKEIWNGSNQFDYPWTYYDWIFPRAFWVHLVRNPFRFAASTADWNRDPLTLDYLEERLRDWTSMQETAGERAATGRYLQLRYEDLADHPRRCLEPILNSRNLAWDPQCLQALDRFKLRSARPRGHGGAAARDALLTLTDTVPGLAQWMQRLDYTVPEGFEQRIAAYDPNFQRASFADLNLLPDEGRGRPGKHRPQHVLQQRIQDLERESEQREHARSQLDKELKHERGKHFVYYFFARRYHRIRTLLG